MRKVFEAMEFAGYLTGRKSSYMSTDQGKFDFPCHGPFKTFPISWLHHFRTLKMSVLTELGCHSPVHNMGKIRKKSTSCLFGVTVGNMDYL